MFLFFKLLNQSSGAQQEIAIRIRRALGARGYSVWIDVEQMSGSTVEAMADAIDRSCLLLAGVSLEYKESQNCRLEAMYAHQVGLKMIPLMLTPGFKPTGD